MKVALPASSLGTPSKAPNSPLVSLGMSPEVECSNEATDPSVRMNGQNPSSSVGASSVVNEMHGRLESQPRRWSRALRTAGYQE